VELAAAFGDAKSGSLILAAIASVFTIRDVANLLGPVCKTARNLLAVIARLGSVCKSNLLNLFKGWRPVGDANIFNKLGCD